jgi:hypothetical protein
MLTGRKKNLQNASASCLGFVTKSSTSLRHIMKDCTFAGTGSEQRLPAGTK